jgi:hypothetical protein
MAVICMLMVLCPSYIGHELVHMIPIARQSAGRMGAP